MIQKPQEQYHLPTTGHNTNVHGEGFRPHETKRSATLHLVDCILLENSCLNRQLKHIQAQVMKARPLTQNLLKQNESMRRLYHQRTRDIKKIIQTISINNEENKLNYQHQCFLLKQLNCSTLKQIKVMDKQRGYINERVSQVNQIFEELSVRKNELEHESLTKLRVRLAKGLSAERVRTKERQNEAEHNKLLLSYSQVNELMIQNSNIIKQLKKRRFNQDPQRQQLIVEREQYEHRIVDAKNLIQAYLQELKTDNEDYSRAVQEKKQKQEKAKRINKSMVDEIRKYEKLQAEWVNINEERQKCKQRISHSARNKEKMQQKLETIKDQRLQIEQKIKMTKQRCQMFILSQNQKSEASDKLTAETTRKFEKDIASILNQSNAQIKKLKSEKLKCENIFEGLSQDYENLEAEVQAYRKTVGCYPNPIAQIQSIELIFRLRNAR